LQFRRGGQDPAGQRRGSRADRGSQGGLAQELPPIQIVALAGDFPGMYRIAVLHTGVRFGFATIDPRRHDNISSKALP
jgi:hypothetical protein